MKLILQQPAKSLSKAYLKQSIKREQIEQFKANLSRLFDRIRDDEHEEHQKNIIADFLKDTWYKPAFEINTSKRTDLVIHNGKSSDDTVGVIIETKKPSNRNEMITPDRPNVKALHELQASIIERVEKILVAPNSPDVPRLEAEIDHLVYALYELAEEEIALVEGKK